MNSTNSINPILDKVLQLTFSDNSIYELFSSANKVYLTIYAHAGDGNKEYLGKIKRVIETQIRPLLEEELTLEEKTKLFNAAITNLEVYIKAYSGQIKS